MKGKGSPRRVFLVPQDACRHTEMLAAGTPYSKASLSAPDTWSWPGSLLESKEQFQQEQGPSLEWKNPKASQGAHCTRLTPCPGMFMAPNCCRLLCRAGRNFHHRCTGMGVAGQRQGETPPAWHWCWPRWHGDMGDVPAPNSCTRLLFRHHWDNLAHRHQGFAPGTQIPPLCPISSFGL